MRATTLVTITIAIYAFSLPSNGQEASTFVPLTGENLRDALLGHYVMSVRSSNGAENFNEGGRWSMTGGRAVEYGTWSLKDDAYCVTMSGGRHWCAQLSREEGDVYTTRYLDGATGMMHGRVTLTFDHEGGPDLGKDDPRNIHLDK